MENIENSKLTYIENLKCIPAPSSVAIFMKSAKINMFGAKPESGQQDEHESGRG